jgi:hypothetical protein
VSITTQTDSSASDLRTLSQIPVATAPFIELPALGRLIVTCMM